MESMVPGDNPYSQCHKYPLIIWRDLLQEGARQAHRGHSNTTVSHANGSIAASRYRRWVPISK